MPADVKQGIDPTSVFFQDHRARLVATRDLGPALDLACGRGRHALALAAEGLRVVALDRNHESLDSLTAAAASCRGLVTTLEEDLESEEPPGLKAACFGAVLVFRYLHRPLMPWIAERLAPGGLLIYETFTRAQRELGWGPKRDAFLLEAGELPGLFPTLETLVYEEGRSRDAQPAETARLLARRPTADPSTT